VGDGIQKIEDNHGQIAQNVSGDQNFIYQQTINNITLHQDSLYFKILQYKKETANFHIHNVTIRYSTDKIITPIITYREISEFIYSNEPLNLKIKIYPDEKNAPLRSHIIHEFDKFIFQYYFDFKHSGYSNKNLHKIFENLIDTVNKILHEYYQNEEDYSKENIKSRTKNVVENFFINHYGKRLKYYNEKNKEFFQYLDEYKIQYTFDGHKAKTIDEFFKFKIKCKENIEGIEWEETYYFIKDYDFDVMRMFLYTDRGDGYEKNLGGLRQFIKDNKYESYMSEEIDGCNPYSLYNICELKICNKENSSNWKYLLCDADVTKEQDIIDDGFEKHMAAFRGDDED